MKAVVNLVPTTKQKFDSKSDNQNFYYQSLSGYLLGSKAREDFILNEFNQITKNDFFLEVGCAQGYYLSKVIKKTKNVFGIEVRKDFVKFANKTGAKVLLASATNLPFKKNEFDYVLCTEVLEHVPNWEKAVSEIYKVTKKNGRVIITVPLEKSFFWKVFSLVYPPEEYRGHINLVTSELVEKIFKKNGFKLKKRKFIQSPFITLNKILPQKEIISMYACFVFEK